MINFKEFQRIGLTRWLGMDKYKNIISMFNDKNINLASKKFTKCFNGFYRVRKDNKRQKVYYKFFNKKRDNKDITFDEILEYLCKKTGNIEASFSSKMLSTINPNMPIWDKYILKNLNIKVKGNSRDEKLKNTKEAYKIIIKKVDEILKDKYTQQAISEFRTFFPDLDFSDTKILDFFLWNNH